MTLGLMRIGTFLVVAGVVVGTAVGILWTQGSSHATGANQAPSAIQGALVGTAIYAAFLLVGLGLMSAGFAALRNVKVRQGDLAEAPPRGLLRRPLWRDWCIELVVAAEALAYLGSVFLQARTTTYPPGPTVNFHPYSVGRDLIAFFVITLLFGLLPTAVRLRVRQAQWALRAAQRDQAAQPWGGR